VLITDDHSQIGEIIEKLEPAAIFGTQMERHVGKRLNIPCGVISAPVHIQNFPLGYRPFLGYEGTNQISDLIYNSFNLGMEDHLLEIFGGAAGSLKREGRKGTGGSAHPALASFASLEERRAGNGQPRPDEGFATRKGSEATALSRSEAPLGVRVSWSEGDGPLGETKVEQPTLVKDDMLVQKWTNEALNELNKVPGFVRAKVKRNTEKYAQSINAVNITVEIMYAAKEAVSSR
jgi:light-independent protochlorophyllide reductase B subunit